MKRWILALVAALASNLAYAQDGKASELFELDPQFGKFRYLQIIGHSGVHIYTGETMDQLLEGGYGALEVRIGWQTKGEYDWEAP